MISASVSFSPYSTYPSAQIKPQGQKGSGAPESKDTTQNVGEEQKTAAPDSTTQPGAAKPDAAKTAQDQKVIAELKKIDSTVRAHEQAHLAAASGLAMGGASFTYRRGPDGQQYAVGGEVSIDASPGKTPQETISKAERIKAAALAPAEPSGQDRAVASNAAQMEAKAQMELLQQKIDAAKGKNSGPAESASNKNAQPANTPPPSSKAHAGIASYRANSTPGETPGSRFSYAA